MVRFLLAFLCISSLSANQSNLANRLHNCEIEVDMLKNSISTQEQAREALQKEVSQLLKATRETLNNNQKGSAQQQKSFSSTVEKLQQDLQTLKKHSNELSTSVNTLSKSIQEIKEGEKQNSRSIKELEQALRALTIAMGGEDRGSDTYIVKSGDSLDKIARDNKTRVNKLKDSNIRPGQSLALK
jgi:predicted  nucleic acid-binding Zn-ribbon protein